MKVKCINGYIDRYIMKPVNVGDVFDVDDKRYEEINKAGSYIEKVETVEPVEDDKPRLKKRGELKDGSDI